MSKVTNNPESSCFSCFRVHHIRLFFFFYFFCLSLCISFWPVIIKHSNCCCCCCSLFLWLGFLSRGRDGRIVYEADEERRQVSSPKVPIFYLLRSCFSSHSAHRIRKFLSEWLLFILGLILLPFTIRMLWNTIFVCFFFELNLIAVKATAQLTHNRRQKLRNESRSLGWSFLFPNDIASISSQQNDKHKKEPYRRMRRSNQPSCSWQTAPVKSKYLYLFFPFFYFCFVFHFCLFLVDSILNRGILSYFSLSLSLSFFLSLSLLLRGVCVFHLRVSFAPPSGRTSTEGVVRVALILVGCWLSVGPPHKMLCYPSSCLTQYTSCPVIFNNWMNRITFNLNS